MGLLCHFQVMHYVRKWLVNIFPDIPTPQSPSDVGHIVITKVDDAGTNPAWHGNLSWAKSMKNMGKKTRQDIDLGIHICHFVKIGGWNSWFSLVGNDEDAKKNDMG